MFCCEGVKNLIGNAGQRGMSVLVYERPGGFRFNLQARAVSKEAELRFSQAPAPLPFEDNVSLATNIGLNYCPFCGTKLKALVTSSTQKQFEKLANEHKKIDEPLW
jgi:hypothetical protein